jgi:glycine cleavage system protein P-like pyridoxal-binding family
MLTIPMPSPESSVAAVPIEPTEAEAKASLELFAATLGDLAMRAEHGVAEHFHEAPRRRLDETGACGSLSSASTMPRGQR